MIHSFKKIFIITTLIFISVNDVSAQENGPHQFAQSNKTQAARRCKSIFEVLGIVRRPLEAIPGIVSETEIIDFIRVLEGTNPIPGTTRRITSRNIEHRDHDLAIEFLKNTVEEMGFKVELEPVEVMGRGFNARPLYNLIVKIEGSDPILKNEKVIFGAHFDTVNRVEEYRREKLGLRPLTRREENEIWASEPAPGGNDNGSGLAVLMGILKVMKEFPPKRSAEVVFFEAEEMGHWGSLTFAANLKNRLQTTESDTEIVSNVVFDEVGNRPENTLRDSNWYRDENGNPVYYFGYFRGPQGRNDVEMAMNLTSDSNIFGISYRLLSGRMASDQMSFHHYEMPSSVVTSYAISFPFRYAAHSPKDLVDAKYQHPTRRGEVMEPVVNSDHMRRMTHYFMGVSYYLTNGIKGSE